MSEKIKSIIGGGYMWNEREEKWIATPPDDPKKPTDEIKPEKELDFEDEFEECDDCTDYDYDLIEYEE